MVANIAVWLDCDLTGWAAGIFLLFFLSFFFFFMVLCSVGGLENVGLVAFVWWVDDCGCRAARFFFFFFSRIG